MKKFILPVLGLLALVSIAKLNLAATSVNSNKQLATNTASTNETINLSPQQVLKLLKEGNARFVSNQMSGHDFLQQAKSTQDAQSPDAVILSCMDSRSAPELLFDQGKGSIFVIRIAGNILNTDELASMEFATKLSTAKLIVVMGHTNCGAVVGACKGVIKGHLSELLAKIEPAIEETAMAAGGKKECNSPDFINTAAKNNVLMIMQQIPQQSPIIKQLLDEHKIMIVGAMHDLATGQVTFFEDPKLS